MHYGEIPKWLKGLVLKTSSTVTGSRGSNPRFSAIYSYRGVEQSGSSSGS